MKVLITEVLFYDDESELGSPMEIEVNDESEVKNYIIESFQSVPESIWYDIIEE